MGEEWMVQRRLSACRLLLLLLLLLLPPLAHPPLPGFLRMIEQVQRFCGAG
jgi:hypothetical protein